MTEADVPSQRVDAGPESGPGSWLSRSVVGLTATQFLGAFNDNLYKTLVLLLFVQLDGSDQQALAFGVFAIPFVLFSGIAGELSERFSKSRIIVWMKWAEVLIMAGAVGAFLINSPTLLLVVLFVMGTQSTFFGPAKYAILPEFVRPGDLVRVNGLVVMTTFLAILGGQVVAGPLVDQLGASLWVASVACLLVAVAGVRTAGMIQDTYPRLPNHPIAPNPFAGLLCTFRSLRRQGAVLGAIVLYAVFFFDAGVINQAIVGLKHEDCLALGDTENWKITVGLLGASSATIALGSFLAPRLSKRRHPAFVVVLGASLVVLGQTALLLIGSVIPKGMGAELFAVACVACAGIGAGLYTVPIVSYIQAVPVAGSKGRAVAFNNWTNFVAIFLAAPFYGLVAILGLPPTIAAASAGAVLVVTVLLSRPTLKALARF